jgi:hypothetical protein
MARTKAQTRAYIAEIVSIKTQIDELNVRKRVLAEKLGLGTWRSRSIPGVKVLIGMTSGGWQVRWKSVAKALAKRLGMTDDELTRATYGHRTKTYGHPTCSVNKDKANRLNPNLKAA